MSLLDNFIYTKEKPVKKIGGLIPVGKTTLLHGRSGCGKTYSILRFLIENDIEPVFIDFDYNDEYDDMNILHIDGHKLGTSIKEGTTAVKAVAKALKGKTVVIDTYAKAKEYLSVENLCSIFDENGITTIVIAHTTYYSGKPPEPGCDEVFANHVGCRLLLEHTVKKTKCETHLYIEKLRGYTGSEIIRDWMRDEEIADMKDFLKNIGG